MAWRAPVSVDAVDITTVADDLVVVHADGIAHRFAGLQPDTEITLAVPGVGELVVRTLARPAGERLATVATVNDLHLGEEVAGAFYDDPRGPRLRSGPGEEPYPLVMNRATADEVAAVGPDAVVAKGDLTDAGRREQCAAFDRCWTDRFGTRLTVVRGNHEGAAAPAAWTGHRVVDVAGLRLAVLDTVVPGCDGGRLDDGALEWLDDAVAASDTPVLALGHHPIWHADDRIYGESFKLDRRSTEALVALVVRRPSLIAYAAGHTHRNVVRHVPDTGAFPYIEVACVKDFPGSWAEYRVFEGGVLQVHHRTSAPAALAWSERCRALYSDFGLDYSTYALGSLDDRCFMIPQR